MDDLNELGGLDLKRLVFSPNRVVTRFGMKALVVEFSTGCLFVPCFFQDPLEENPRSGSDTAVNSLQAVHLSFSLPFGPWGPKPHVPRPVIHRYPPAPTTPVQVGW